MRYLLANRFTILLAVLLGFILIVPAMVDHMGTTTLMPWALSLIVLAILLATKDSNTLLHHPVITTIALGALITMWSCGCVFGLETLNKVDGCIFTLLLLGSCRNILGTLAKRKHVNHETLTAAVSVYILFGLALSRIYWLLHIFDPHSFHIVIPQNATADQPDFLYYSFVVMTTVGFGDIVPVTKLARSITNVQAIMSVFYLTITISRLVSLYRSDEQGLESDQPLKSAP